MSLIIAYAMRHDRASSSENRRGGREVEIGVAVAVWIQASVNILGVCVESVLVLGQ